MAGEEISGLPALAGADVADDDRFVVLDVDDTSSAPHSAPTGTTKGVRKDELAAALNIVDYVSYVGGTRTDLLVQGAATIEAHYEFTAGVGPALTYATGGNPAHVMVLHWPSVSIVVETVTNGGTGTIIPGAAGVTAEILAALDTLAPDVPAGYLLSEILIGSGAYNISRGFIGGVQWTGFCDGSGVPTGFDGVQFTDALIADDALYWTPDIGSLFFSYNPI